MGSFLFNWPRRWHRVAPATAKSVPDGTQSEPVSFQQQVPTSTACLFQRNFLYQGTVALLVCWKKAQSFTHPPAKHKGREPFLSQRQRFSQHRGLQQPRCRCWLSMAQMPAAPSHHVKGTGLGVSWGLKWARRLR